MPDWLDGVAGAGYTQAIFWTFGALILLVIVLVIIKLIRSMTFGTFVAGGRNRKTRLAVMDATAVDSHRRLVLVRRDDVEHLLLIGGPTDVVVERDIKLGQRRPIATEAQPSVAIQGPAPQQGPAQLPAAAPRPRAAEPARQAQPTPPRAPAPAAPRPPEAQPARPAPRPEPPRAAAPANPPRPEPRPAPAMPQAAPFNPPLRAPAEDLDDELLKELQVSLDESDDQVEKRSPSLDDEMTKLLGELSSPRK